MKAKRLIRIALLGALLPIVQTVLAPIPGIELVSLLIVEFSLIFPKESVWACFIYVLIEGFLFGFGSWWLGYLVVWPAFSILSAILARIFGENWILWTIYLGIFGLLFGTWFTLPKLFIDPAYAFSWWIAGLPHDLMHCIGNVIVSLLLGKPLYKIFKRLAK